MEKEKSMNMPEHIRYGGEPGYHKWLYKNADRLMKEGHYIHPSHIEAGRKACQKSIITTN